MKKSSLILGIGAVFLLSSCTVKTTENNRRTVAVSGTGTVEVEADNATVILSVITRGKDVTAAADENASKMNKIQDSIVELGISKENITTDDYSIYQETEYRNGKNVPGDYRVTNKIKVFLQDLSLVSSVIDNSLKNGANEFSNIEYGVSNKDIFVKQARTNAILNAQEAANLLAGTSNSTLGKVLSINEHHNIVTGKTFSSRANDMMLESKMAPTPISARKSSISITVDAVYELK